MSISTQHLSSSIHSILNDVVEQCFRQMLQSPDNRKYIEEIIDEASDDIVRLESMLKEPFSLRGYSTQEELYAAVYKQLHKRSLIHLNRLQKIENNSSFRA